MGAGALQHHQRIFERLSNDEIEQAATTIAADRLSSGGDPFAMQAQT
jgi:hypothetical protein